MSASGTPRVYWLAIYLSTSTAADSPKKDATLLTSAIDVSSFSFLQRTQIPAFLKLSSSIVASRAQDTNQITRIIENSANSAGGSSTPIYVLKKDNLVYITITNEVYPEKSAAQILYDTRINFLNSYSPNIFVNYNSNANLPPPQIEFDEKISSLLKGYQDPNQTSAIGRVQSELDETKAILHKTIEAVLERGEKLDDLVTKSDQLSATSKMFYTQAKKTNSCCIVM